SCLASVTCYSGGLKVSNTSLNYSWNITTTNITDYEKITNFTNMSNYNSFFVPINEVWISAMSGWFWLLIIFLTTGVVLIKSRSIFPTSFTLLLLSSVLVSAVPAEIASILYLLMVLGFFGVLWGLFESRGA
ncbi:MAG: hypothetical protein KAW93_00705, partial [Methanogenium sp.]|nr:hypothetical protein [Methanogenium sp.]